ncbi:Peptidase M12B propeptide, partial [Trinorchestia longiramus]
MPILMRSVFVRPVLALVVLMLGGCLVSLSKSPPEILTLLQDLAPQNLPERSARSTSGEELSASSDVRFIGSDASDIEYDHNHELKSGILNFEVNHSESDSVDVSDTFSSSKYDTGIIYQDREHVSPTTNETSELPRRYKRDSAADEEVDSSTLRVWVTPFHRQDTQGSFTHSQDESLPHTLSMPSTLTVTSERLLTRGFEWVAWGQLWQIVAWHDSHFLAPSLLLREEGRARSRVQPSDGIARCFFKGYVVGHRHSSDVALSACDGL